jgi:2-haloacid dehalogenase
MTGPGDPPVTRPVIRNVVFDIGGVLLDWQPSLVYQDLIPDPDERRRFLAEVCTTEWNLTLDAGRPFDEACAELAARHPDQVERIEAWKRQDEMIAGEVPGTAAIVERLKAKGVPLHLLTNMPSDVFRARRDRYPVLQAFDGAVVSGDEGVLKPSAEIFAILLKRFDLDPARTLFVDDAEVNVEGARTAGLRAHRFVDAAGLEAALTGLHLL